MDEKQPEPHARTIQTTRSSDGYFENGMLVYTGAYHLKRGYCCGSGCRHFPYEPRHLKGTTTARR